MRGPINYQASQVWLKIDGLGKSKAECRKEHPVKNINNTGVTSPLVHSFGYKDEIFKTARNLFNFAHERGIKDMTKLNFLTVETWFQNKIDRDVSRDTLRNYLSHITKIQIALEAISNEEKNKYLGYTKAELNELHDEVKAMEKNGYINRSYRRAGLVVGMLRDLRHNMAGNLQWKYGLRITEAGLIKSSQLVDTTLTVTGKGGYKLIKELSDDDAKYLRELFVDGIFKISHKQYRNAIEDACIMLHEKYRGSHGLRYNFAQELFNKRFNHLHYIEGLPPLVAEENSLLEVSEAMGHHRKEITCRYLGG